VTVQNNLNGLIETGEPSLEIIAIIFWGSDTRRENKKRTLANSTQGTQKN